jgi:myo-inositol-1-phosphate synthase
MTHDGLGKYLSQVIEKAPGPTADIAGILRATKTDVVVSYLPVGSEMATKWYVEQILEAGCAFINCIPVFIASEPYWQKRFEERGLPIIGDDIKSQVGATITHRVLTNLFRERGVRLDRTYQLNFGGNTDFMNMLERERLESKKISKTNAVLSQLEQPLSSEQAHVGPSDYVPWLTDRKWCYIRMEGTTFGNVPLNCELKLEVWDSPNSAGVVIDAIRCARLALNRGLAGALVGPSSYFMKTPPQQFTDSVARELVEAFIAGRQPFTELCGISPQTSGNSGESHPAPPVSTSLNRGSIPNSSAHDRSNQVVERTEQSVALGFSQRPGMERVCGNDPPGGVRDPAKATEAPPGPGRDVAD